jgi:16S rRNA (adenine1518-N6/adenine1519-N6)-dimethyltransferase
LQTLSEIRALLAERGLRPRRRFGQNFLHDKNQLRRLVDASGACAGDLVLEVGPGTGTLTEALVDAGAEVIASEIDNDLASIIEERLGERVTLVRGDCLARGRSLAPAIVEALGARPFRLVANLPYQVASPLMITLLLDHPACTGQFVTIQKEVADRLLAPPGTKAYGPLGIIAQVLGTIEPIAVLPPSCFWPAPAVTSAMVAIRPRPQGAVEHPHELARFITMLFGRRRKQLGAILGRDLAWPSGVTAELRPEALSPEQLVALWAEARDDH